MQVETLLDLKQKQANVDEARMARWQAEVTQNQSRSVMVFTIFTVMSVLSVLPSQSPAFSTIPADM